MRGSRQACVVVEQEVGERQEGQQCHVMSVTQAWYACRTKMPTLFLIQPAHMHSTHTQGMAELCWRNAHTHNVKNRSSYRNHNICLPLHTRSLMHFMPCHACLMPHVSEGCFMLWLCCVVWFMHQNSCYSCLPATEGSHCTAKCSCHVHANGPGVSCTDHA